MTQFLSDTGARVYVAGHRGMVGSAIVRALQAAGFDIQTDFFCQVFFVFDFHKFI